MTEGCHATVGRHQQASSSDDPNQYHPHQPRDEDTDCNTGGGCQVAVPLFLLAGRRLVASTQERYQVWAYVLRAARPTALHRMRGFGHIGAVEQIGHVAAHWKPVLRLLGQHPQGLFTQWSESRTTQRIWKHCVQVAKSIDMSS